MPRDDMTKYLVHWTKGADYGEAFETLCQIVEVAFSYAVIHVEQPN
jgi:hypothetical protein